MHIPRYKTTKRVTPQRLIGLLEGGNRRGVATCSCYYIPALNVIALDRYTAAEMLGVVGLETLNARYSYLRLDPTALPLEALADIQARWDAEHRARQVVIIVNADGSYTYKEQPEDGQEQAEQEQDGDPI